jgi:hypothetical protein
LAGGSRGNPRPYTQTHEQQAETSARTAQSHESQAESSASTAQSAASDAQQAAASTSHY